MTPLSNADLRKLKARAQLLDAKFHVGKQGLSPQFLQALAEAFQHHDLIKVKFKELTEQKRELSPQIAAQTGSQFIHMVGHVAIFYRPKPAEPAAN